MPDLILLCAGAAPDLTQDGPPGAASDAAHAARAIAGGAFARAFARGAIAIDEHDESALPRELPDERWLRQRFAVPERDSIEAWSFRSFAGTPAGWHATPVNVQVGHYQLLLTNPAELALTDEEAHALADAARPVLDEAGLSLRVASPLHWFLEGRADWRLDTRAWTMAVGRSIDGYLPAGPDARAWRRVFTDVQIAWHEHPVNVERESRGRRAINALWLDGFASGSLPPGGATVLTRDPALAGLATAAGCTVAPFEPDAPALPPAGGDLLIDLSLWRAPRRDGDPSQWLDAWSRFDRWMAAAGLAGGAPRGFDRMRAVFGGERRLIELTVSRAQRWQPWRRFDALGAVLGR